ncbi:MAG: Ig-like domain-containing protein [Armatimonadota bacterium]
MLNCITVRRRWPSLIIIVACLMLTITAHAAQFLEFSAQRQSNGIAVSANETGLMRFRDGALGLGAAERLAAALNAFAMQGGKPEQITVKKGTVNSCQIMLNGTALLTVDQGLARSANSMPEPLARSWADNIRKALAKPYVMIEPRGRMQIPLGERRTLRWGGNATADLSFSSANPAVAAVKLDGSGQFLLVEGTGIGATAVTAMLGPQLLTLPVEVKTWAARLKQPVVAEITNPPLPTDDLRRTLRNAILYATQPAPTATIELGEPRRSGNSYLVELRATGQDCFAVNQTVSVTLKPLSRPKQRVQELLVSNAPERITEPATLLRERLLGAAPVRLLWHHVNSSTQPVRFAVRVANLGKTDARLHVTEAATGPHNDEIFVGHSAMMRYFALTAQGEGYYLNVPAGRMLDLYDTRLVPDRIVSGLATLSPGAGSDLIIEVVAENVWPTDAFFMPIPTRLTNDPPLTPYRFEASKNVELRHEAGGAWTFYHIGKEYSVNLQGQKLFGDYGVDYSIEATFANPSDKPAKCEIGLRASGGVARATFVLDGELTETGLLRGSNEQVIYKSELQPGQQRVVKLLTMPESGSNYPLTLTMRSSQ